MDHPPSTTSSPRRARRALLSAAALTALAVPGTVTSSDGPSLISLVSAAESDSPAVRFQGTTTDQLTLPNRPLRSEVEGLQGLPSTTVAPVAQVVAVPPAPPTTAAPTPTTAPPPPPAPAPAPAPVPAPAPAPAPAPTAGRGDPNDPATWDRLAQCEASGNWHINSGNGYYGGLQFSASTWRSVGGTGLPHQHSRETQIEMGQRLQARTGWSSWPSCSRKLGYR